MNCSRIAPLFIVCLLPASLALPARAQSAKLVSIEVKGSLPEAAKDVAFGQFPDKGVKVEAGFLVDPGPGASIVDIDEKKCKIAGVVDAQTGQPSPLKVKFGNFPRTSKEAGGPAYHELELANAAETPAGRIKVTGTVSARISKGSATEKVATLTLADGVVVKAGEFALKVKDLKSEDGKLTFSLHSSKPMAAIKQIRFLTADGKTVKSKKGGSSSMSGFGTFSESWEFEVESAAKEFSLEVDLFKDLEDKDIAFEFTLPTGL